MLSSIKNVIQRLSVRVPSRPSVCTLASQSALIGHNKYSFSTHIQEKPGPGIGSYEDVEKQLESIGGYQQLLSNKDTQIAVDKLKTYIESGLCKELNLFRVECPLIVDETRGVNDYLDRDGSRTPVDFYINYKIFLFILIFR